MGLEPLVVQVGMCARAWGRWWCMWACALGHGHGAAGGMWAGLGADVAGGMGLVVQVGVV